MRLLKFSGPCHTSTCSLELSPDYLFCLYHVSLCDYGSGCQSRALNNDSSDSPSMHGEMISPFYPESGTTLCSLICIILTLAVLKSLKGCVSTHAPGISSQKVTGCPLLALMQVMLSSENFNDSWDTSNRSSQNSYQSGNFAKYYCIIFLSATE